MHPELQGLLIVLGAGGALAMLLHKSNVSPEKLDRWEWAAEGWRQAVDWRRFWKRLGILAVLLFLLVPAGHEYTEAWAEALVDGINELADYWFGVWTLLDGYLVDFIAVSALNLTVAALLWYGTGLVTRRREDR